MRKAKACLLTCTLVSAVLFALASPAGASGDTFKTVSASLWVSMGIKEDGSLWTWGNEYGGLLGDGKESLTACPEPQKVLDGVVMVSSSVTHTLAVVAGGDLYGWGSGFWGQLGPEKDEHTGYYISSTTPVKIMQGVKAASAGDRYSMVIKTDGSLWAFGENISGQLGTGQTDIDQHGTPVKIMDGVASVSAANTPYPHTLAVKTDGTLWAWGMNMYGELGDGTTASRYSPVQVMDGVAAVATGEGMVSFAIKTDGSLWGWGANLYGVLGPDAEASQKTPCRILDSVASVAVGEDHALAVKKDGSLWAWGSQLYGKLGDGVDRNNWADPKKVLGGVAAVAVGKRHTLVVKTDGTLWAFGGNDYGELGPAVAIGAVQATPAQVASGFRIPPGATVTAVPTQSTVLVNGTLTAFDAYNINGSNYFKLRDLAFAVNGTPKQFEVGWDADNNAISLTSGAAYTPIGGEMAVSGSTAPKAATPTTSRIFLDGGEASFTAFNIGGYNYFKLRDVAAAIDFAVIWDGATSTIGIDTSQGYTAP